MMAKLYGATAVICLIMILVGVIIWTIKRYPNIKKERKYIQKAAPEEAHGIIFGKLGKKVCYSPSAQEGHTLVIGGTGLGKTSALLIPTLRSWDGTSFTIDISGDISSNVEMPHKLIFQPGNPNTAPYNVFGMIDDLPFVDDQDEALEQLAHLIMPDLQNSNANADYFHRGGRQILTAALIAFYHQGMDFTDICQQIAGSGYPALFSAIDAAGNERATMYINGFEGTSETNTSGCKQNVDDAVKLFAASPPVMAALHRPGEGEEAFSPLSLEDHNCFVRVEDAALESYAPLLHIITAQCLSYLSSRDTATPILLCLDEFASLGKLEITPALRKLRKKHVRIMVLTQSMADLDVLYGYAERMAMLANFSFKAILGAADVDTQTYFADLIGKEDRAKTSTTKGPGLLATASTTTTTEQRYIIEPSDLAVLGDALLLLYPGGYKRLRKNFYFMQ